MDVRARRVVYGAAVAFMLVVSATCSTVSVKTDFAQRADFTRYRTFKLAGCQPSNATCTAGGTLLVDRIGGALQDQLQARGLRPEASRPDLVVVYGAITRTKYDLVQPPGDPPWGGFGGDIWQDDIRQGTVVLNFVDARTNETVWTARARTYQQNFDSPAVVQQTVARALEGYPPAPRL